MQRRVALAIALALTVITVFSIVAVGTRGSLFSRKSDGEAQAIAPSPIPIPPTTAPAVVPPQSAPEPVVITEYVYRDVSVPAPGGFQPSAQQVAAPQVPVAAAPTAPGTDNPEPTQPAAPPPSATPRAAPPTAAPPSPEPPAAPTQPPAPPASAPTGPSELEFTGTVASISGDVVTFSHGGSTTAVRVTKDLDELGVGTRAKVHAIKTQSGYVAKEIEVDEN